MEKMKLPCVFENISPLEDDKRLVKCLIKVQHDKENLNGSYFDKEDIQRCAEKSLRYTPILGSVVYDENDEEYRLNGHDMDFKIVETDNGCELKISHIERIYGFIPHDANIYFEYDVEKDKNYLITEGYLWKNYMDELEDILGKKDGKTQVSMEISVDESFKREDDLYQITNYTFEGITMLGVPEAMVGANLQLFSEDILSKFKAEMENLINVYSMEKEVDTLNKNEIKEFEISVDNIRDQVVTQLSERLVDRTDFWGDTYKGLEFFFISILPEEKIIIVENADYSRVEYFGIPYTITNNLVTLDFDSKKPYICEWTELIDEVETVEVNIEDINFKEHIIDKFNSIDIHEKEVEELNELKVRFNEIEEKLQDYEELKEFKAAYDKAKLESEIKEISSRFNLEHDEYKDLEDKAILGKLSKEDYMKELYCLIGMKQVELSANFNKVEQSTCEVKIKNNIKTSSRYGELGKKYSK